MSTRIGSCERSRFKSIREYDRSRERLPGMVAGPHWAKSWIPFPVVCVVPVNKPAFLDEVSLPRQLPTRTTMVLLNRPSYRSAFRGFIEFHKRAAMRVVEPRLDEPLENLPDLYQLWGTLVVVQVLLEVGADLGYRVRAEQLVRRELGGLCMRVLPDGKPAVVLVHPETRTIVKLTPERTYGRDDELRSISFSQRPDIAIEVDSPDRETTVYLFDPKYKLNSEQMGSHRGRRRRFSPSGCAQEGRHRQDALVSRRDSRRRSAQSGALRGDPLPGPRSPIRRRHRGAVRVSRKNREFSGAPA